MSLCPLFESVVSVGLAINILVKLDGHPSWSERMRVLVVLWGHCVSVCVPEGTPSHTKLLGIPELLYANEVLSCVFSVNQ